MDLQTLDAEVFVRHAQRVETMLENPRQRECLLNAACTDTPIVREILAAGETIRSRGGPRAAETLARMEQDLVTFLALRDLEQEEMAAQWVRRVGAN